MAKHKAKAVKQLAIACRAAYCHIIMRCPNVDWPDNHAISDETFCASHTLDLLRNAYAQATGSTLPDPLPFVRDETAT